MTIVKFPRYSYVIKSYLPSRAWTARPPATRTRWPNTPENRDEPISNPVLSGRERRAFTHGRRRAPNAGAHSRPGGPPGGLAASRRARDQRLSACSSKVGVPWAFGPRIVYPLVYATLLHILMPCDLLAPHDRSDVRETARQRLQTLGQRVTSAGLATLSSRRKSRSRELVRTAPLSDYRATRLH